MADPHIHSMKPWIDTFAEDVGVLERVVENQAVPRAARLLAAGALGYLVTRLDLIPDWEETCGLLDDAMVMRVAALLASEKGLDELPADALRGASRLVNEAEMIPDFLGGELYARFKHYVEQLPTKVVRGRSAESVVDDAKVRGHLHGEVADELKRLPPAPMSDPDHVARTIKNYLKQKLS
jgi:uncharacterized membrane protein YkvA (DUF1232 family)